MINQSWRSVLGEILSASVGLYVFMLVWDVVDGASRWQRKQEEDNKRELAEGWKRWEAGDWMMK